MKPARCLQQGVDTTAGTQLPAEYHCKTVQSGHTRGVRRKWVGRPRRNHYRARTDAGVVLAQELFIGGRHDSDHVGILHGLSLECTERIVQHLLSYPSDLELVYGEEVP